MGIPFKRLLLAGVGGGLIFTFAKILIPDWSLPLAIAAGVGFIFLSAQQGGIPRWQRFLYYLRGSLMLLAERHPESLPGQAARMLELPAGTDHTGFFAHLCTTDDPHRSQSD